MNRSRGTSLVGVLIVILLLSACGAGVQDGRTAGNALASGGSAVALAFHTKEIKPGARFGFSFPAMKNVSDEPIVLTGVKLLHVPAGIRVEKYRLLSVHDTPGQVLDSRLGARDGTDYEMFPNHKLTEKIKIGIGAVSTFYPVVYVRVTGPAKGKSASGCEYLYRQGGQEFAQTLKCEFDFHDLH